MLEWKDLGQVDIQVQRVAAALDRTPPVVEEEDLPLPADLPAQCLGDELLVHLRGDRRDQVPAVGGQGRERDAFAAGALELQQQLQPDRKVEVVLADGSVIRTGGQPRAAVGPDLTQLFVGAEGTLGVVTEVTLRARPAPAVDQRAAWGYETFAAGLDACRRMLRRGISPAVLRLYDRIESKRNFDLDTNVLLVLDEGDPVMVDAVLAVPGAELLFGGKPLSGHEIPACYGAWEPTAIRVPASLNSGSLRIS